MMDKTHDDQNSKASLLQPFPSIFTSTAQSTSFLNDSSFFDQFSSSKRLLPYVEDHEDVEYRVDVPIRGVKVRWDAIHLFHTKVCCV